MATSPSMGFVAPGSKAGIACDGTSSGEEAHRGRDGSRISEACSESSESSSSDDTRRPFSGEDCAGLVLACLHCRFHEFTRLLLDAFARAVGHDFPSVDRVTESGERDRQEWEHWPFDLGLDWDFCSSCQDSAELLELAMEISEMCYR
ncbi:myoD family inhibitor domain-containing protein 2-like [Syngnathoides biaculeatus]|uniref:myoD family inhibitor domain-containing protein 2-like n=1 Tax=Syngnathoides biaculeatus TaxID=300417 RepID=UPI002ADDDE02|nr:myoD family inhibitor domain-containing protein 2-like [Syngnathoides biaculeatus]